ncbi:origin recognition complex subunit 3 N-terminus-domain-containing protein [Syncephalis fuscata]|nr:origin recognition complex subunit 3 N-terminus-domain-containing protein [Syncephalis fuscata]
MPDFDIHTLLAWYEHLANEEASNLVVIFQDFESFNSTVLHDLITICSEYTTRLPFIFVFGVATSMETVHQSLTFSALSLLRTEKFKLQEANECLNTIVDQLFISNDYGFQLGLAPFNLILDRFTLHNLSVDSVVNTLHYAVMAHFYSNPLSFMACQLEEELEMTTKCLTSNHADWIRMQPSFQRHVESLVILPEEAKKLLKNDDYLLRICLPDWIRELRLHRIKTAAAFHILLAIQRHLSSLPNRRRELRIMHMFALREDLGDSPLVIQTCRAIQHVDSSELRDILMDVYELLDSAQLYDTEPKCIADFIQALDKAEQHYRAKYKNTKKELANLVVRSAWEKTNRTTQKSLSKPVVLRPDASPAEVEYSNLTKEVAEWLETFFKRDFTNHTHNTLYECSYFSSSSLLQKTFAPQLRATTQTALRLPVHYLGCHCCRERSSNISSSSTILRTQPDTCILYQLHLECGRWINLHDWFISYRSIVEPKMTTDDDRSEKAMMLR